MHSTGAQGGLIQADPERWTDFPCSFTLSLTEAGRLRREMIVILSAFASFNVLNACAPCARRRHELR